jgi:hypothetical protein
LKFVMVFDILDDARIVASCNICQLEITQSKARSVKQY